jgi:GTPase SAR1 family protein
VLHFCAGLPIILVGLKCDLRNDAKTMEELKKTRQAPVSTEEVLSRVFNNRFRQWLSHKRLELTSTWNALHERARESRRFSSMLPEPRLRSTSERVESQSASCCSLFVFCQEFFRNLLSGDPFSTMLAFQLNSLDYSVSCLSIKQPRLQCQLPFN